MRPSWVKIVVSLVALWVVVGGVMWWMNRSKPTPEKVATYVETHPLEGKSEVERREVIETVAKQVVRLELEERNQARPRLALDTFWKTLTAAERAHYYTLVVPKGLQQMIEHFNSLPPDRRKREIEKAVARMRSEAEDEVPQDVDPAIAKRFVDDGLKAFYRDATIEAKMDAMPLIEELEKSFKWRR